MAVKAADVLFSCLDFPTVYIQAPFLNTPFGSCATIYKPASFLTPELAISFK